MGAAGAGGIDDVRGTATASSPDWSLLPSDLIVVVMAALESPVDLVRSGAVCYSWHAAYTTVRSLLIESPPCLFYTRADYGNDPNAATIYNPARGTSFRVRMPALRSLSLHGSAHGWLITADNASNLHLVNPVTGVQLALPPITALHHTEAAASDEQGSPMYNVYEDPSMDPEPTTYTARELRLYMYLKAVPSCSPCAGSECVILLLHQQCVGELSFARLGDKVWTWIENDKDDEEWPDYGYRDAVYNNKDGLFYVLGYGADIITVDLKGGSPVVKRIMEDVTNNEDPTKYLVMAPWGDLLQVWRMTDDSRSAATPVQAAEWMDFEVLDPYHELYTEEVQLYKVDIDSQKLVRMTSLGEYALFLGLNSTMILSTKDFPMLKADCAYLVHDHSEDIYTHPYNGKEIRVWNFKSGTLEDVDDNVTSWQNWPVPIWITPSLS